MKRKYKPDMVNLFMTPQKLNLCKYDLIIYRKEVKSIITQTINREAVLVDLIKLANEKADNQEVKYNLHFKIYLTEDGIKSLFLDSKADREFINLLYEKNERC